MTCIMLCIRIFFLYIPVYFSLKISKFNIQVHKKCLVCSKDTVLNPLIEINRQSTDYKSSTLTSDTSICVEAFFN